MEPIIKDLIWVFTVIVTVLINFRVSVLEIRYIRKDVDAISLDIQKLNQEIKNLLVSLAEIKTKQNK